MKGNNHIEDTPIVHLKGNRPLRLILDPPVSNWNSTQPLIQQDSSATASTSDSEESADSVDPVLQKTIGGGSDVSLGPVVIVSSKTLRPV